MNEELERLHSNLLDKGYDLPDINQFYIDMGDPSKRQKLHSNLVGKGYNLPDFNTFSIDMGVQTEAEKKENGFIENLKLKTKDNNKKTISAKQSANLTSVGEKIFGVDLYSKTNERFNQGTKMLSILGSAGVDAIGGVLGATYGVAQEGLEKVGLKEEDNVNNIFSNNVHTISDYLKSLMTNKIKTTYKPPEKQYNEDGEILEDGIEKGLRNLKDKALNDPAFWYNDGADGLSSLLSFIGIGGVAGKGDKIAKLGTRLLGKADDGAEVVGKVARMKNYARSLGDGVVGASAAVAFEGVLEGKGIYEEVYEANIAKGIDPEVAKFKASTAAAETFKANAMLLGVPGLIQLNNMFKSINTKGVIRGALKLGAKTIVGAATEGFQESTQTAIGLYEKSKYIDGEYAEDGVNDVGYGNILKEYVEAVQTGNSEIYESFFLGNVLGGGTAGVVNAANYAKDLFVQDKDGGILTDDTGKPIMNQEAVKQHLNYISTITDQKALIDQANKDKDPELFNVAKREIIRSAIEKHFIHEEGNKIEDVKERTRALIEEKLGNSEDMTEEEREDAIEEYLGEVDNMYNLYEEVALVADKNGMDAKQTAMLLDFRSKEDWAEKTINRYKGALEATQSKNSVLDKRKKNDIMKSLVMLEEYQTENKKALSKLLSVKPKDPKEEAIKEEKPPKEKIEEGNGDVPTSVASELDKQTIEKINYTSFVNNEHIEQFKLENGIVDNPTLENALRRKLNNQFLKEEAINLGEMDPNVRYADAPLLKEVEENKIDAKFRELVGDTAEALLNQPFETKFEERNYQRIALEYYESRIPAAKEKPVDEKKVDKDRVDNKKAVKSINTGKVNKLEVGQKFHYINDKNKRETIFQIDSIVDGEVTATNSKGDSYSFSEKGFTDRINQNGPVSFIPYMKPTAHGPFKTYVHTISKDSRDDLKDEIHEYFIEGSNYVNSGQLKADDVVQLEVNKSHPYGDPLRNSNEMIVDVVVYHDNKRKVVGLLPDLNKVANNKEFNKLRKTREAIFKQATESSSTLVKSPYTLKVKDVLGSYSKTHNNPEGITRANSRPIKEVKGLKNGDVKLSLIVGKGKNKKAILSHKLDAEVRGKGPKHMNTGFNHLLMKDPGGKYIPIRLYTPFIKEEPELQNKIINSLKKGDLREVNNYVDLSDVIDNIETKGKTISVFLKDKLIARGNVKEVYESLGIDDKIVQVKQDFHKNETGLNHIKKYVRTDLGDKNKVTDSFFRASYFAIDDIVKDRKEKEVVDPTEVEQEEEFSEFVSPDKEQEEDLSDVDFDYHITDNPDFVPENDKQWFKWFRERFPEIGYKVSDEDIKKLYDIYNLGGASIYGVFKGASVLLASKRPEGTTREEAFHVAFNLFFNNNQKKKFYLEALQRYPKTLKYTKQQVLDAINNPQTSNSKGDGTTPKDSIEFAKQRGKILQAIEETIAKEFRELQAQDGTPQNVIQKLLKKLYDFILDGVGVVRSYLHDPNIDQLFRNIDRNTLGKNLLGKRKKTTQELFSRNVSKLISPRFSLSSMTPFQERRAISLLNRDFLPQILEANKIESLEEHFKHSKNINQGLSRLYGAIVGNEKKKGLLEIRLEGLKKLAAKDERYQASVDRVENIKKLLRKGLPVLSKMGRGEFLDSSSYNTEEIRFLQDLILDLRHSHGVNISATASNDVKSIEDSLEIGEGELNELWQVNYIKSNPHEAVSGRLKNLLGKIPVLVTKMKKVDGKLKKVKVPKKDGIGGIVYEDSTVVFNKLINGLSGSRDLNDMSDRLDALAVHENFATQLVDILNDKDNDNLNREFYTRFGGMVTANFMNMKFENGKLQIFNSNRQGLVNSMIDSFRNNLEALFFDNTSFDIDQKQINAIGKVIERIEERKSVFPLTKNIVNVFTAFGISVTPKIIHNLEDGIKVNGKVIHGGEGKAVISALEDLQVILDRVNKGLTVFGPEASADTASRLKNIFSILSKADNSLGLLNFLNIKGEKVYNNIQSNYLWRKVSDLLRDRGNSVENVKHLYFDATAPIYKWIDNTSYNIELKLLDGYKVNNIGIQYTDFSDALSNVVNINAFIESISDNTSFYRMPTLADASVSYFMRLPVFKIKEELGVSNYYEEIFAVAMQEYNRITKSTQDTGIKNFEENKNKFHFFPTLTIKDFGDLDANGKISEANKTNVQNKIEEYLEKEFNNFARSLANQNVILKNKEKNIYVRSEDLVKNANGIKIGKEIYSESFKDSLRLYHHNQFLMNTQMLTISSGDPAMYKRDIQKKQISPKKDKNGKKIPDNRRDVTEADYEAALTSLDYQKRHKQVHSPGLTYAFTKPNYSTVYLNTIEKSSVGLIAGQEKNEDTPIYKYLTDIGFDHDLATTITKSYRKNDTTDGQAYHTIDRRRDIEIAAGRWPKNGIKEKAYKKVKAGEQLTGQEALIFLTPIKPQVYDQIEVSDSNKKGLKIPVQHKDSEITLIPSLAAADKTGNLQKLLDAMNKNDIDVALFDSAVKVGGYNIIDFNDLENIPKNAIHSMSNSAWKEQGKVPQHLLDAKNLFGTQIRKHILSNLKPEEKGLYDKFHKAFSENIEEDLNALHVELSMNSTNKGKMLDELRARLFKEFDERSLQDKYKSALDIVGTGPLKADVDFAMPLWHPHIAGRVEPIINSFFKKVIKQKFNGPSLINVAQLGFDDLQIKFKEKDGKLNSIEYVEVAMPRWLADMNDLSIGDIADPSVLEGVVYRIPTEGKYSMFPIRVKTFLPTESSGIIVMPPEVTTIAGLDFDIDKVFAMMYHLKKNKKGELVRNDGKDVVDKDGNVVKIAQDSRERRDNDILDVVRDILTSPNHMEEMLYPGSFEYLKKIHKRLVNEKLIKKNKGSMNIASPASQIAFSNGNLMGKKLIGIVANNSAFHSLNQGLGLTTNGIMYNGELLNKIGLHKEVGPDTKTVDGVKQNIHKKNVSRAFQILAAATVDNAKDPILAALNINEHTINELSFLIHHGVSLMSAIRFINKPIVKSYVKYADAYKLNSDKGSVEDFYSNQKGFKPSKEKPDIVTAKSDKEVLLALVQISKQARDLNKVVQAVRFDSGGSGPTMIEIDHLITTHIGIWSKIKEKTFNVHGVEKILPKVHKELDKTTNTTEYSIESESEVSTINDFYKVILSEVNYASNFFPYFNEGFQNIKKDLSEELLNDHEFFTASQIKHINNFIINYNAHTHYHVPSQYISLDSFLKKFPKAFIKESKELMSTRYAPLLSIFKTKKSRNRVVLTTKRSTGLSPDALNNLDVLFEDLLRNKKYAKLANDLIAYSFLTTGFNFTRDGFSELIPVSYFKERREMLDSIKESNDLLGNNTEEQEKIKDIMIRNLHSVLVPYINKADIKPQMDGKLIRSFKLPKGHKYDELPHLNIKDERTDEVALYANNGHIFERIESFGIAGQVFQYNMLGEKLPENILKFTKSLKKFDKTKPRDLAKEVLEASGQIVEDTEEVSNNEFVTGDSIKDAPQDDRKNKDGLFLRLKDGKNDKKNNEKLKNFLQELLNRKGIEIMSVDKWLENFKDRHLDTSEKDRIVALADTLNKTIAFSKTDERGNPIIDSDTLSEETGHLIEQIIFENDKELWTQLLNSTDETGGSYIENTAIYIENAEAYKKEYGDNNVKLKREILGKIIGEHIQIQYKKNELGKKNRFLQLLSKAVDLVLNMFKTSPLKGIPKAINELLAGEVNEYFNSDALTSTSGLVLSKKGKRTDSITEVATNLVDTFERKERALKAREDRIKGNLRPLYNRLETTYAGQNILAEIKLIEDKAFRSEEDIKRLKDLYNLITLRSASKKEQKDIKSLVKLAETTFKLKEDIKNNREARALEDFLLGIKKLKLGEEATSKVKREGGLKQEIKTTLKVIEKYRENDNQVTLYEYEQLKEFIDYKKPAIKALMQLVNEGHDFKEMEKPNKFKKSVSKAFKDMKEIETFVDSRLAEIMRPILVRANTRPDGTLINPNLKAEDTLENILNSSLTERMYTDRTVLDYWVGDVSNSDNPLLGMAAKEINNIVKSVDRWTKDKGDEITKYVFEQKDHIEKDKRFAKKLKKYGYSSLEESLYELDHKGKLTGYYQSKYNIGGANGFETKRQEQAEIIYKKIEAHAKKLGVDLVLTRGQNSEASKARDQELKGLYLSESTILTKSEKKAEFKKRKELTRMYRGLWQTWFINNTDPIFIENAKEKMKNELPPEVFNRILADSKITNSNSIKEIEKLELQLEEATLKLEANPDVQKWKDWKANLISRLDRAKTEASTFNWSINYIIEKRRHEKSEIGFKEWLESNIKRDMAGNLYYSGELVTPAAKYENKVYKDFNSHESNGEKAWSNLKNKLETEVHEAKGKLPDIYSASYAVRNRAIAITESMMDLALTKHGIFTKRGLSRLSERFRDKVKDAFKLKVDDDLYGTDPNLLSELGFRNKVPPIRYISKMENPNLLSRDVFSSLIIFHEMAENYVAMSKALPKLGVYREVLKNGRYKFPKGRSLRKGKFNNSEVDSIAKGKESNTFKNFNEFIDKFVFGDSFIPGTKQIGDKLINADKINNSIATYLRSKNLQGNFAAAGTAMMTTFVGTAMEAYIGTHTTWESALWASKKVLGNMRHIVSEFGKVTREHPVNRFIDKLTILKGNVDRFNNLNKKRSVRNLFGILNYGIWKFGDYFPKAIAIMSLAHNHRKIDGKWYDRQGFFSIGGTKEQWAEAREDNFYNEFLNNEEGISESLWNRVNNKAQRLTDHIDSQPSEIAKGMLTRRAAASYILLHRLYLPQIKERGFKRKQFNYISEKEEMGSLAATGSVLSALVTDGGMLSLEEMKSRYSELSYAEQEGWRRSVALAAFGVTFYIFVKIMLAAIDDDEENDESALTQYGAYVMVRIFKEVTAQVNPFELINLASRPVAGLEIFETMGIIFSELTNNLAFWKDLEEGKEISRGVYEGKSKLKRALIKATPFGIGKSYETFPLNTPITQGAKGNKGKRVYVWNN